MGGQLPPLSPQFRRPCFVNHQESIFKWVFLSLFRGQSNDIKSLILLGEHDMISGGVTTDVCVYKLIKGYLGD